MLVYDFSVVNHAIWWIIVFSVVTLDMIFLLDILKDCWPSGVTTEKLLN